MDKDAQAREMFDQGYSIRNVADRLSVDFATARGWKNDYEAAKERRKDPAPEGATPIQAVGDSPSEEPEVWDITLQVPTAKLDDILSTFSSL